MMVLVFLGAWYVALEPTAFTSARTSDDFLLPGACRLPDGDLPAGASNLPLVAGKDSSAEGF